MKKKKTNLKNGNDLWAQLYLLTWNVFNKKKEKKTSSDYECKLYLGWSASVFANYKALLSAQSFCPSIFNFPPPGKFYIFFIQFILMCITSLLYIKNCTIQAAPCLKKSFKIRKIFLIFFFFKRHDISTLNVLTKICFVFFPWIFVCLAQCHWTVRRSM